MSEEQQANPLVAEGVLTVEYRRAAIAREMESLRDNYFKLIRKTVSVVESVSPSERDVKRFSKYYMTSVVTMVEDLFDQLEPLYFLDYMLLEKIVRFLLPEQDDSVIGELDMLDEFKFSATLKQFMESIETAQQPLNTSETPRTCTIILKLVGGWLEKTIAGLDKLLKVLFQDKSSVLTHLKIVRGSVIITYLAPRSEADSLIVIAQCRNILFMRKIGVCALQIRKTVVTSTQSDETTDFSFESSLIDAVLNYDFDVLSFLLDINTSPDAADNNGNTALIYCSHFARKKAVELLLKANANISVQAKNGITPLYAVSSNGHSDVVRMLLKANADHNIQENGATPLFIACLEGHFNVVSILLENNADPNHQAGDFGTPLYCASQNGHDDVVDLLLKTNANPNLLAEDSITDLYAASDNGHSDTVSMLLKANY